MRHRVQGQDLLETEPCEHRVVTTGSQLKGRAEHGALRCDLQRCCVGQGHSSTGHAAPNQRHAAGSQRPPVIAGVGMDCAPAKRAAEELHGASGKSSQRVRMFRRLVQQQNIYLCGELGRIHGNREEQQPPASLWNQAVNVLYRTRQGLRRGKAPRR